MDIERKILQFHLEWYIFESTQRDCTDFSPVEGGVVIFIARGHSPLVIGCWKSLMIDSIDPANTPRFRWDYFFSTLPYLNTFNLGNQLALKNFFQEPSDELRLQEYWVYLYWICGWFHKRRDRSRKSDVIICIELRTPEDMGHMCWSKNSRKDMAHMCCKYPFLGFKQD